jgi:hypothetical protein
MRIARRWIATLVGMALLMGTGLTGTAAATSSKVRVTGYETGGPKGQVLGEVRSAKTRCEDNRKVTVFRREESGKTKLGSARTNFLEDKYRFAVYDDEPLPAVGTHFYAVAAAEDGCAKETSPDFVFDF